MDRSTPIIPAVYVFAYVDLLSVFDFSIEDISRVSGLELVPGEYGAQAFSVEEVIRIIQGVYKLTETPHLGLVIGSALGMGFHGFGGITAMTQATCRDGLKAASRLTQQVFPALKSELFEADGRVGLRMTTHFSLAPIEEFFFETIMMSFYNTLHFIHGANYEPEYIALPYAPPPYAELYQKFFKCEIRFNADSCEFVVSDSLADSCLPLANSKIAAVAETDFRRFIPEENLNDLKRRLRDLLFVSEGVFPSMEEAAHALGMSERTLRRQLSKLGTNFQTELDYVRKELAVRYLKNGEMSITDIALNLGFYDSSAFNKLFKKWTGEAPSFYRKRLGKKLG